jgi:hypothetical protein
LSNSATRRISAVGRDPAEPEDLEDREEDEDFVVDGGMVYLKSLLCIGFRQAALAAPRLGRAS